MILEITPYCFVRYEPSWQTTQTFDRILHHAGRSPTITAALRSATYILDVDSATYGTPPSSAPLAPDGGCHQCGAKRHNIELLSALVGRCRSTCSLRHNTAPHICIDKATNRHRFGSIDRNTLPSSTHHSIRVDLNAAIMKTTLDWITVTLVLALVAGKHSHLRSCVRVYVCVCDNYRAVLLIRHIHTSTFWSRTKVKVLRRQEALLAVRCTRFSVCLLVCLWSQNTFTLYFIGWRVVIRIAYCRYMFHMERSKSSVRAIIFMYIHWHWKTSIIHNKI